MTTDCNCFLSFVLRESILNLLVSWWCKSPKQWARTVWGPHCTRHIQVINLLTVWLLLCESKFFLCYVEVFFYVMFCMFKFFLMLWLKSLLIPDHFHLWSPVDGTICQVPPEQGMSSKQPDTHDAHLSCSSLFSPVSLHLHLFPPLPLSHPTTLWLVLIM